MRRAALLTLSLCLSTIFVAAAAAQEEKPAAPPRPAPEVAALHLEVGKLRGEIAALSKQVEALKKAQDEARPQIDMLLKHRHSLFLDVMRADALLPKAKGLFLITTPSPEDFSKTSGPVSGPK
jgi:hypothetical protein